MRSNSSLSPFKSGIYSAEDSLHSKMRGLDQEISMLNQENVLLRGKVKKVNELEDKIQLVLRHNTNLLNENQQLSRLLNQRKSEGELLKNKYEALVIQSSTTNEIEVKKLKNQIERLNDQIIEIDQLKKMEIGEMKAHLTQEIQYVRKGNMSSLETADFQYRKLKEVCDSKDYEISELSLKMNRIVKDTELELLRLKEEKERLRKEIEIQQEEHRGVVANLKAKFESNLHLEIESLKKQHLNQMNELAFENSKIKDMTAGKNAEIEQIMSKNLKVKHNYQEEILLLKKENEILKDKLVELERISQLEIANLREKLENMRDSEVSLLKSAHLNQTEILVNEVKTLEDIIATKNEEIQGLIKERNQSRGAFESEIRRLKAELDASEQDNKQAQQVHDTNIGRLEKEIKSKNEESRVLEATFNDQVSTLNNELGLVQNLLKEKVAEFENYARQAEANEKNLNQQIKTFRNNLDDLASEHERSKEQSSTEIGDIKKLYESRIQNLNEQIRSLQEQNQQKSSIIATLKATIEVKDGELDTQGKNVASLERMLGKAKKDLEENKVLSSNKEAEHNRITEQQRDRMISTFDFELSNAKSEHNNQVSGLNLQIADLKKELRQKTNKLQELKKMYEKLVKETERVLTDEARRKELDIKQPGWLPDTISTKGLFDVFLKNKVIEWCDV